MSTSYQTTAKSRDRREGDSIDKQSSSRNSSQVPSRLSRTASRPYEDDPTPRGTRPDSPALFWQRNKTIDSSRPGDSVVMSPRGSAASGRADRAPPTSAPADDKTPTPSSPTKSSKSVSSRRSLESARGSNASIGFGLDNVEARQSSSIISQKPGSQSGASRLSRPSSKGSGLSQVATSQMQPKVSDASEEDTSSQISRPRDIPSSRTSPDLNSAQVSEVGERKPTAASTAPPAQPEVPPMPSPYQPPNISTSAISPPQSPQQMYQQPMYPSQPAPYPYGYPPNQHLPGGFYAGAFSPSGRDLPRSPSVVNREEHLQILEKVTNVLPDINRLLEHYQETQGQLSAKDLMAKQTELMRTEEIARLRLELDAKKEEYDKLIERLVGENFKYKLEVEEKTASIASLETTIKEYEAMKTELKAMKAKHDEAIAFADAARLAKESLLAEKLDLETTHKSNLEAKEKEHSKAASEHKIMLSKVQLELANLITKHSSVKKEFESSRGIILGHEQRLDTTAKEFETALVAHQAELEARTKKAEQLQNEHRQQLESQLESLTSSRQQEIQSLREAHDQELKDMMSNHEANAAKLAENHTTQMTEIRGELDGQKDAFGKLQTQHDEMGAKHSELSGAIMTWKRRHEDWQVENDKLNKLLGTLGHTSDSKPDEAYSAAFELLAQSIEIISKDYFSQPPEGSPMQLNMLVEPNLPEVLGSTETAVELRSIMIQHKIFKVLHQRIFQPFVFVPFEDLSGTAVDQLLRPLSQMIYQKSHRREALWRSITLRAIYSGSEARNSIGFVAAMVLDEILLQVEDLSMPSSRGPLIASLREVVKSSTELWRQTQVEVDRISSAMPDVSNQHSLSNVLLWVRPHIVRERIGGTSMSNWGQEDTSLGESRVILHGTALRQDSPLVLKRYEELARRVSLS